MDSEVTNYCLRRLPNQRPIRWLLVVTLREHATSSPRSKRRADAPAGSPTGAPGGCSRNLEEHLYQRWPGLLAAPRRGPKLL